jgi:two-component system, OmpR family, sensor histidine kinase QseC
MQGVGRWFVPWAQRWGRPRTLLGRLLAWAIGAFALVWFGFAVIGFQTGLHEADELTDGHLASVASLLLSQSAIDFTQARERVAEQASMRAHDYQQSLSVVVWDDAGRIVSRTGDAPLPPSNTADGFDTLSLGSPPSGWRSFTRWKADRSRRVMVLLSIDERDELAWDIGAQVVEPGWWFLPVLALVLGLAIRRGLRPLDRLTQEVHSLDVQRAEPLAPGERPREFAAVVDAINMLVGRYHAALTHEQQLANELAHELRTPLASLALHAGALQQPLDEAARGASLKRVEQDALRAGQLLGELLALARASRTELADAAVPLDLVALAQRVLAEYAQAALDSAHDIGLVAPPAWPVSGHPVLLEMALRNLLDNALAHTPPGTTVELQLDAAAGWLQVCDDGARAAPQPELPLEPAQEPVHVSPQQGDAPQPRVLGLGLGHRVVEKVAVIHGGRFAAVEPPTGFSTCYRISLRA